MRSCRSDFDDAAFAAPVARKQRQREAMNFFIREVLSFFRTWIARRLGCFDLGQSWEPEVAHSPTGFTSRNIGVQHHPASAYSIATFERCTERRNSKSLHQADYTRSIELRQQNTVADE